MKRVRVMGIKQDARGNTYLHITRVDDDDDVVSDETVDSFLEWTEQTAPAAPAANSVRVFSEDNGSGKTRLVAKFASGANVVLATQA